MAEPTTTDTVRALNLLISQVRNKEKPILYWIGAGASSWCGYPRWSEVADNFHGKFSSDATGYDKNCAFAHLQNETFPDLFQICKDTDSHLYNKLLVDTFSVRDITPVYERFLRALRGNSPICAVTTNVDEMLEKHLSECDTIDRSDIERAQTLLINRQPFICKLHGSVSHIESTVFTSDDYAALCNDTSFCAFLERVLGTATVLFVGYGLQDEYIFSMLRRNHELAKLFGDGPHFAILPEANVVLPESVCHLQYTPEPHDDHRIAIQYLEEMAVSRNQEENEKISEVRGEIYSEAFRSAHLLSDILPPGRWTTSHTMDLEGQNGTIDRQLIVGNGFRDGEMPFVASTAMHDFLVGLLCFDKVYAPVAAIGRLHSMVESDRFWRLVQNDVIGFVMWTEYVGLVFPGADSVKGGDLVCTSLLDRDLRKSVREQLNPNPGKETEYEKLISDLEVKTIEITDVQEGNIAGLTKSLLHKPSIRKLLGISGGTPLSGLARWQAFPVLRLANVVKIGAACRILGIGSAKLNFGTAKLAGPAFATAMGLECPDDVASYVIAGKYGLDIGSMVVDDLSILDAIIQFRETEAGESLRREVISRLAASEGAEVNVAINGGLESAIPSRILKSSQNQFADLLVRQGTSQAPSPAIWNEERYDEEALRGWKRRSMKELKAHCRQFHIRPNMACPCGSGERLRDCCYESLGA